MIDPALDKGGLKDSENAPNSVFSKINESPFWRFGTDMLSYLHFWAMVLCELCSLTNQSTEE